jgi:hypothetical protein
LISGLGGYAGAVDIVIELVIAKRARDESRLNSVSNEERYRPPRQLPAQPAEMKGHVSDL